MIMYSVSYFAENSREQQCERKRRRAAKRQLAKLQTSDHAVSNVQLDPLPKEDRPVNMQTNSEHTHDQLLAYEKFKISYTKEIDEMIVKGLQNKYKQRLQVAEKDNFESRADTEPLDDSEESQERGTLVEVTEVNKAYAELINESVSTECGPPLLLPAVIQPVDKVTISSEIKDEVQVQ